MWIKLLGICLVCVSCAGIGGGEALCLIGRRRFLEEVKRIAAGLQGEIGYTQAVLPLALCRAGARGDGYTMRLSCRSKFAVFVPMKMISSVTTSWMVFVPVNTRSTT